MTAEVVNMSPCHLYRPDRQPGEFCCSVHGITFRGHFSERLCPIGELERKIEALELLVAAQVAELKNPTAAVSSPIADYAADAGSWDRGAGFRQAVGVFVDWMMQHNLGRPEDVAITIECEAPLRNAIMQSVPYPHPPQGSLRSYGVQIKLEHTGNRPPAAPDDLVLHCGPHLYDGAERSYRIPWWVLRNDLDRIGWKLERKT